MDRLFILVVAVTALVAGYVIYDTAQEVGYEFDRQAQTAEVFSSVKK